MKIGIISFKGKAFELFNLLEGLKDSDLTLGDIAEMKKSNKTKLKISYK